MKELVKSEITVSQIYCHKTFEICVKIEIHRHLQTRFDNTLKIIKYLESVRDLYEQGVSPDQYNSLPIEMLNEKTFEYICNINDMGLWESALHVEPMYISNASREKIYINGEEFTLEEVNTIPLYLTGINVEQYSFSRVTNTVYEGYKQYVYVYPEYFTIAYLCEEEGYKYFSYDGKGMELITAHKEYIDSLNHNT